MTAHEDTIKTKNPEGFAQNYIFFRFPSNYTLVILPLAIAIITNIFFQSLQDVSTIGTGRIELIEQSQFDVIDDYLITFKLSFIILLAFFVCYRWSNMQNGGAYGFWITQGVKKRNFFLTIVFKFLVILYFCEVLGLLAIFYLNNLYVDITTFILLNLLIMTHILIYIGMAILIGTVMTSPELAALTYIIVMGLNYALITSETSLLHQLFQSDIHYKFDNGWLSLLLSFIISQVILFVSYRLHIKQDVEL